MTWNRPSQFHDPIIKRASTTKHHHVLWGVRHVTCHAMCSICKWEGIMQNRPSNNVVWVTVLFVCCRLGKGTRDTEYLQFFMWERVRCLKEGRPLKSRANTGCVCRQLVTLVSLRFEVYLERKSSWLKKTIHFNKDKKHKQQSRTIQRRRNESLQYVPILLLTPNNRYEMVQGSRKNGKCTSTSPHSVEM